MRALKISLTMVIVASSFLFTKLSIIYIFYIVTNKEFVELKPGDETYLDIDKLKMKRIAGNDMRLVDD